MVLSNKEWLDKMDEIISAIQNNGVDSQVIMDMLSNMWSSSVTYNVGDYVLYNNNIWKCLIQNSNIAPTEGSTWTSVKITNEISTLNSSLYEKIEKIFEGKVTGNFEIKKSILDYSAIIFITSDGIHYLKPKDNTYLVDCDNYTAIGAETNLNIYVFNNGRTFTNYNATIYAILGIK